MPEEAATIIETSPTAKQLKAKTDAAIQSTGYETDFDKNFDEALKKDAESKPVEKQADPPPAPKPAAKTVEKVDMIPDVPEAAIDPKAAPKPEPTEAEKQAAREKDIAEQVKGMSPKAADRFRAIEKRAHEAEARAVKAAELEKKLAEAEQRAATPANIEEVNGLKKQVEEMDKIIQTAALTDHPRFKAAFDAPIAEAMAEAKTYVPTEKAEEFEALMKMAPSKLRNGAINAILEDLGPVEANAVGMRVAEIDRKRSQREAQLGNWQENKARMAKLQKEEQEQMRIQANQASESAIKVTLTRLTDPDKGLELFREVAGNEPWNAQVKTRVDAVKKIASGTLTQQDIAELAVTAVAAPEYRSLFLGQRALVRKLQQEIASMKGAEPNLRTGDAKPTEGEDNDSFTDSVIKGSREAGFIQ